MIIFQLHLIGSSQSCFLESTNIWFYLVEDVWCACFFRIPVTHIVTQDCQGGCGCSCSSSSPPDSPYWLPPACCRRQCSTSSRACCWVLAGFPSMGKVWVTCPSTMPGSSCLSFSQAIAVIFLLLLTLQFSASRLQAEFSCPGGPLISSPPS